VRSAALLRADLDNPPMPDSNLLHPLAFANKQRQRFFDIHILAGGTAQHREQCVPVIGSGDNDGVDVPGIEQTAKVRMADRLVARRRHAFLTPTAVDLGNTKQIDIGDSPKRGNMPFAD
jgi:hypothetical protein